MLSIHISEYSTLWFVSLLTNLECTPCLQTETCCSCSILVVFMAQQKKYSWLNKQRTPLSESTTNTSLRQLWLNSESSYNTAIDQMTNIQVNTNRIIVLNATRPLSCHCVRMILVCFDHEYQRVLKNMICWSSYKDTYAPSAFRQLDATVTAAFPLLVAQRTTGFLSWLHDIQGTPSTPTQLCRLWEHSLDTDNTQFGPGLDSNSH